MTGSGQRAGGQPRRGAGVASVALQLKAQQVSISSKPVSAVCLLLTTRDYASATVDLRLFRIAGIAMFQLRKGEARGQCTGHASEKKKPALSTEHSSD